MKKLLSLILVLTGGIIHALPVANPADPMLYSNHLIFDSDVDYCDPCGTLYDLFSLRLGFWGNYVYDRHLEGDSSEPLSVQMMTNAGLFVLDVCDWIDLFATVGVTRVYESTNVSGTFQEVFYSPEMSYTGGARIVVWNCDNWYVGIEGQYFYTKTQRDSQVTFAAAARGTQAYFNSSHDRKASYGEWQVSLATAYQFMDASRLSFIPFAAIQFAGVNWNRARTLDNGTNIQSLEQQKTVGWTLGMTALLCDIIGVTVEGRWANEKALSVIGQLSF